MKIKFKTIESSMQTATNTQKYISTFESVEKDYHRVFCDSLCECVGVESAVTCCCCCFRIKSFVTHKTIAN